MTSRWRVVVARIRQYNNNDHSAGNDEGHERYCHEKGPDQSGVLQRARTSEHDHVVDAESQKKGSSPETIEEVGRGMVDEGKSLQDNAAAAEHERQYTAQKEIDAKGVRQEDPLLIVRGVTLVHLTVTVAIGHVGIRVDLDHR